MSGADRLGAALARWIGNIVRAGESAYIVMEGIRADVAHAIVAAWPTDGLPLAVASSANEDFGDVALGSASGTGLRNSHPEGFCLIVCEGTVLPDRQSLNAFENVAPADLLRNTESLSLIAEVEPAVSLDGVTRNVRAAIDMLPLAEQPSALAVASYFAELAAGGAPLESLPKLGAFRDDAHGDDATQSRIRDNLMLGAFRRSEELQRHGTLGDVRRKAEAVLARRPDLTTHEATVAADRVIDCLQAGDDQLLIDLTFDEAREILERRQRLSLAEAVAQELEDYRRKKEAEDSSATEIPWERYAHNAADLDTSTTRREAAFALLAFDDTEEHRCFQRETRKKLERLLKDRVLRVSQPSCPERGLLGAAIQLRGGLKRILLAGPEPIGENPTPSRRNAARGLAICCARLRLGQLLRALDETYGVEVDAALLESAEPPWPEAFEDAEFDGGKQLETVRLRLLGDDNDVLVLEWKPDLDDIALLRASVYFGSERTVLGRLTGSPTLTQFCAGPYPANAPVPPEMNTLADELQRCANVALQEGLSPAILDHWTGTWRDELADALDADQERVPFGHVGCMEGGGAIAMTAWAPLKAEWLSQYLDALWTLVYSAVDDQGDTLEPLDITARGVSEATASHYPAHIRAPWSDRPLLPTSETRVWSTFGGPVAESAQHGGTALRSVLGKLLELQPEAAGHLRCLAVGPGAADLVVTECVKLIGTRVGGAEVGKVEIFCIDDGTEAQPRRGTLAWVDEEMAGVGRDRLELRYLDDLQSAKARLLASGSSSPAVHLGVICGITEHAARLAIEAPEIPLPPITDEALFVPRTSVRPGQSRRMILAPPASTELARMWLKLMHSIEDSWPADDEFVTVPELRTVGSDLRRPLRDIHDLALWVATIDPYATRDSLQHAMGEDVAILHQERRLGGDSPTALVISQKSGGPADRAIGRSLQAAQIVSNQDAALTIGTELRTVASQGYGILALEAATTGAGINELVGHVVAFSMLATTATPWPLPPECRLLLVSLDDYKHWFPGKRGDLLVLALDGPAEGVHAAVIEVKARRSDAGVAANDALDQLKQTLQITRWAAYPEEDSLHSRLWLNRIVEAAIAVARESRIKLNEAELDALEAFRNGMGTLEWAGVGMVFGPDLTELQRDRQFPLAGDLVPISISAIRLTQDRLRAAAGTDLTRLTTVKASRPPLEGGRRRRRPERRPAASEEPHHAGLRSSEENTMSGSDAKRDRLGTSQESDVPEPADETEPSEAKPPEQQSVNFIPPILGWQLSNKEPLHWNAAGPEALPNGHMEIWGSSGAGKTQFVMALLSQLASTNGTHFGIADFKNDYGDRFPTQADATFVDLWEGANYNPLALPSTDPREIRSAVIELRDIVDVATQAFARLGVRQKSKLKTALEDAYSTVQATQVWPTFATLHELLDDDLQGVIGDLTGEPIFGQGKPLGDAVEENVVFGLSRIPGNGLTTVLAAGFILSALQLRMQGLPQVANTVRYAVVVDEAHRVAAFRAIDTMIREGRSKGLAVILATQQPGDLPEVVATNAQSRVCFRLPDATVASAAARRLDPNDRDLAEQIRTLASGEAFVSLGGQRPQLVRMAQNYRDRATLGLPS